MKVCVIANSLVNFILILLHMKQSSCITIDRESRDIIDSLAINNCDSIRKTFIQQGRCKCAEIASIASTDTAGIGCIRNKDIDRRKYTRILFNSLLFFFIKNVAVLSLLFLFKLIHWKQSTQSSQLLLMKAYGVVLDDM